MSPTLPHAPKWSEKTEFSTCSCNWSHDYTYKSCGDHEGVTSLSSMYEAARDGCVRCKLLLRGIEKYTVPPYRPHRPAEATLSEYEPDPGLVVLVRNAPDTPLRVKLCSTDMANKLENLLMDLYFYNHLDKPPYFSDIKPAGHVPADSASQACFDTVRQWIKQCDDLHPQCSPKADMSTTPTRLISVGSSSDDIKLCSSGEIPAGASYVALSHTWGLEEERMKAMPLLFKGNLSSRMSGILWTELTQTFQDAITITRNIGVPYLWIDSLCIFQDDHGDWAKEASRMAALYKNAYLVIAATSAKNGDDGCLRPRIPSYDISESATGSFHVQQRISHHTLIETQADSTDMPLLDRAWCFQERLLACRILHYTEREMMWECREEIWCECQTIQGRPARSDLNNPYPMNSYTFKLYYAAVMASADPELRIKSWVTVVREYSQRSLTFGTDRLPGISGIAREIALPGLGRYLAGLWEREFPGALLWSSVAGVLDRPLVLPRPLQYSAPTWSWASILSAVKLRQDWVAKTTVTVCRVIDVTCTPKTADPYGHVGDGRLRISGPTIAATLTRTDRRQEITRYDVVLNTTNLVVPGREADSAFKSNILLTEPAISVLILFVQVRSFDTLSDLAEGLVLVQSKIHNGYWERIGSFHGWDFELSQAKETELIIV